MPKAAIPVVWSDTVAFSKLAEDCTVFLAVARGASPRTCENYRLAYGQFRGHLQQLGLSDDVRHFNPDTVESFAKALAAGGNKPSSVNTKLSALKSLGDYGTRTKHPRYQQSPDIGRKRSPYILEENPVTRVERPARQRPAERFLYRDEIRKL